MSLKATTMHLLLWIILISVVTARIASKRQVLARFRAYHGDAFINIHSIRSRRIEIGFNYVPGAVSYRITANLRKARVELGKISFENIVSGDVRTASVRRLKPGREYVIRVTGLNEEGQEIGVGSEKVIRTAQRCFICNGKRRNEECRGTIRDCPAGHACLNQVRYSNGIPIYTKMCGQWKQNLADATSPAKACSGDTKRDGVCISMCRDDLCNKAQLTIATDCRDFLPTPRNGTIQCTRGKDIGSLCGWSCLPGFELSGPRVSECREDRTWSLTTPPTCTERKTVEVVTKPIHGAPCDPIESVENASVRCSNKNYPGSVCVFTCTPDYYLFGHMSRTCDVKTRKWDGRPPSCVERAKVLQQNITRVENPLRRNIRRKKRF